MNALVGKECWWFDLNIFENLTKKDAVPVMASLWGQTLGSVLNVTVGKHRCI
jgi:hypothetical protein